MTGTCAWKGELRAAAVGGASARQGQAKGTSTVTGREAGPPGVQLRACPMLSRESLHQPDSELPLGGEDGHIPTPWISQQESRRPPHASHGTWLSAASSPVTDVCAP